MGAFLKELSTEARSLLPWTLWVTISLAVAIAGPFGSYGAMTANMRVLFWTPIIAVALIVAAVVRAYVYGSLRWGSTMKGSLAATGLNCLLICPPLYLLLNVVFPQMFTVTTHFGEIFLLVASISLGVCALRNSAENEALEANESQMEPAPAAPRAPRLMRRIDPDLQGEIWAITVRDHYVDVQTSVGKSSILMRFSDAIDEVDCQPGAQVHRSHWVAWSGVGSVCREGGKMILHLKNGHQIPVSRNNREKVDAMFPLMPAAKTVAA